MHQCFWMLLLYCSSVGKGSKVKVIIVITVYWYFSVTLKVLITQLQQTFVCLLLFFFSEKIRLDMSCESSAIIADDSHEMPSLIFSEK